MLDLTFGEQVKIILSRKGMTIKELAEKEKKRNVVNEDLEKHNIFEKLEREVAKSPTMTEDKNIEINIEDEKEVGE